MPATAMPTNIQPIATKSPNPAHSAVERLGRTAKPTTARPIAA